MDDNDEWLAASHDVYDEHDDVDTDPHPEPCMLDYYGACSDYALYDGMCEYHYDMAKAGMLRGLNG